MFADLYHSTRRALRRGVSNPIDKEEFITTRQTRAEQLLTQAGLPRERWQQIWASYTEEYFLRHRPEEIAWHTRVLAESGNPGSIVRLERLLGEHPSSPAGARPSGHKVSDVLDPWGFGERK